MHQKQHEYIQAYVRRFLRLRAQAPSVPDGIVVEAVVKGYAYVQRPSTSQGNCPNP
jgi:hypothetical protein